MRAQVTRTAVTGAIIGAAFLPGTVRFARRCAVVFASVAIYVVPVVALLTSSSVDNVVAAAGAVGTAGLASGGQIRVIAGVGSVDLAVPANRFNDARGHRSILITKIIEFSIPIQ